MKRCEDCIFLFSTHLERYTVYREILAELNFVDGQILVLRQLFACLIFRGQG